MGKGKQYGSQHFVPRCYTAAWCDSECPQEMEPYVWVFPAGERVGRRKAPKNIFVESDFYTYKADDGTRDVGIEQSLGALESEFVIVRDKLARHEKVTSEEYAVLLAFVAAMDGRTKAQRDHHRSQWKRVRAKMDIMIAHWERSTPEQRKALVNHPGNQIADDSEPGRSYDDVVSMVENPMRHTLRATIGIVTRLLARMNLAVIEASDAAIFVTSDNPFVVFDREAHKRPPMFRSPVFASRSTEVTLPISPRHLLLFSHEPLVGYVPADKWTADEFNRRTIGWAYEEYVVNRNETRDVWFESRPEPEDSWEKEHARKKKAEI